MLSSLKSNVVMVILVRDEKHRICLRRVKLYRNSIKDVVSNGFYSTYNWLINDASNKITIRQAINGINCDNSKKVGFNYIILPEMIPISYNFSRMIGSWYTINNKNKKRLHPIDPLLVVRLQNDNDPIILKYYTPDKIFMDAPNIIETKTFEQSVKRTWVQTYHNKIQKKREYTFVIYEPAHTNKVLCNFPDLCCSIPKDELIFEKYKIIRLVYDNVKGQFITEICNDLI